MNGQLPGDSEPAGVGAVRVLSPQDRLRRERALRRRRARIRRNRLKAGTLLIVIALGCYGLVGLISPTQKMSAQTVVSASVVGPTVHVTGRLDSFTWPDKGEGAVGLQTGGVIGVSPRQRLVPIASMTKMMTALVIIRDHPLRAGQSGPHLTMSAADATAWTLDEQNNDAIVPVRRGERLSEYQLLEALLIPSGDNIADLLASWDARSMAKFVAKMNLYARSLGLAQTVYADASGVSPMSRSTPADQVRVAGVLMENPVLRAIVGKASVPFPIAGTLTNVNPVLGINGIVGVKSGFTSRANGCLATAAMHTVGGKRVMVIAVATGNLDGLYGAGRVDNQLLLEAERSLTTITPTTHKVAVTSASLLGTERSVGMHIAGGVPRLVAWPGLQITSHVELRRENNLRGSRVVATLVYTSPTGVLGTARLTDDSSS